MAQDFQRSGGACTVEQFHVQDTPDHPDSPRCSGQTSAGCALQRVWRLLPAGAVPARHGFVASSPWCLCRAALGRRGAAVPLRRAHGAGRGAAAGFTRATATMGTLVVTRPGVVGEAVDRRRPGLRQHRRARRVDAAAAWLSGFTDNKARSGPRTTAH